jgi:hypothetical protein
MLKHKIKILNFYLASLTALKTFVNYIRKIRIDKERMIKDMVEDNVKG